MHQVKNVRHLETKIRLFEDKIIRSKNMGEIEQINKVLMKMRRRLQKLQYQESC